MATLSKDKWCEFCHISPGQTDLMTTAALTKTFKSNKIYDKKLTTTDTDIGFSKVRSLVVHPNCGDAPVAKHWIFIKDSISCRCKGCYEGSEDDHIRPVSPASAGPARAALPQPHPSTPHTHIHTDPPAAAAATACCHRRRKHADTRKHTRTHARAHTRALVHMHTHAHMRT
jgi:hypothetical protein